MKLVWHDDAMLEMDWLRFVFGGLVTDETTDLSLTCFDDDTIHVISMIRAPLASYQAYFQACRERCGNLVLFHGSDEWFSRGRRPFSGGFGAYRYFDAVIRTHHTYLADGRGILTIPLGYPDQTRTDIQPRALTARPYVWSFTGEIKTTRIKMLNVFEGLEPALVYKTNTIHRPEGFKLSKQEYSKILEDTMFLPCPMGNAVAETWRLYEGLELGCIPLVERRPTIDYYRNLFGPDHPIPTFDNWAEARSWVETQLSDKHALLQTQTLIGNWWRTYKQTVANRVRDLLAVSHRGELVRFADRLPNRYPLLYEPLRLAEMLRHQTGDSVARTFARRSRKALKISTNLLR